MALNTPGFDFASRDYTNIRNDLMLRAGRVTPEWVDRDPSDFGVLMVDLWAYMGDILHYYIDRAAGEAFVSTATQKESMLALANLFDYTPFTRTSSTAIVYVSNTSSASVTIPANTVFIGLGESDNLEFFSNSDVVVNSGSSNVAINVTQGTKIVEEVLTTSASGQVGQKYSLAKLSAVPTSAQVYVYEDGVTPTAWNKVTDIALSPTSSSVYSVNVNANNETQIVFGNRISGRVPPTNAKITATYNITNGAAGNLGQNKITSFKSAQPYGIAITSSSAAIGGSSGETVDSIKTSLKAVIKSQNRAVTLQDFVDLTLIIPGVYKAVAKYDPSLTSGGSVTVYGLPYISSYTSYAAASVGIPASVQSEIVSSIQPLATLGVTVLAGSTITLVPKSISATIYVDESYVASSVSSAVSSALDVLFELNGIGFGEDLKIGDVYRAIHNVEGVLYATVTISGSTPTNIQLIKKGTYTLVTSGGITTLS